MSAGRIRRTRTSYTAKHQEIDERINNFINNKSAPWPPREQLLPHGEGKQYRMHRFRVELLHDNGDVLSDEDMRRYLTEAIRYYHAATAWKVKGQYILRDYRVFIDKDTK